MGFSPSQDPSGTLQLVAAIYSGTTGTPDGGSLVLMILYDQGCRAGAQRFLLGYGESGSNSCDRLNRSIDRLGRFLELILRHKSLGTPPERTHWEGAHLGLF
jgi:hypothetical protein